ncbi:MAG: TlyA family RNA methyltransferase [Actinobacteria bacterium]|nr:TlyA family RNA methyltransferase [Actinomycetota bacterium]
MSSLRRLDIELVRRHLARSREQAQALISAGSVKVNGFIADKAARQVSDSVSIVLDADDAHWVSRGAHKLIGALDSFAPMGLAVQGKVCLDAGASTGGFTQVLLERGASKVYAVDVGYGQLAWPLRNDARVVVMERVNIRYMTPDALAERPEVVVADLSFISLTLVLPAFAALTSDTGNMVLMVKPQFEVGRDSLSPGGVVRDPHSRVKAVARVAAAAAAIGWPAVGVIASPLPGPSGNVEYFLWLQPASAATPLELSHIEEAVQEGPK